MKQAEYAKLTPHAKRILHETHLAYQRAKLAKDPASQAAGMPENVVRGVRRKASPREMSTYAQTFNPGWFTGLRDNFWKAYAETTIDMMQFISRGMKNA